MLLWATSGTLAAAAPERASSAPVVVIVVVVVPAVLVMVLLAPRLAITVARLLRAREHGLCGVGNGARNVLGRIIDVELLVNVLGDGLDFSAQLLLDLVQVESILPVDQIDSQTQVTESSGTTDTMEISFSVLREVKVDHHVHGLDIDTTSQQVGADQVPAYAVAEVVEDAVAVLLEHPSVRVETRVAQFSDLLGQKLDTVGGIAENDGLVDLQLREQGVEAVDFLLLFHESVILGDTTQGKLVHKVDLIRVAHMLVLEGLDNEGEGGTEEHDLAILGVE